MNDSKKVGTHFSTPPSHRDKNSAGIVTDGVNEVATTTTMKISISSSTITSTSMANLARCKSETETEVQTDTDILLVSFNYSKRFNTAFENRIDTSSESNHTIEMTDNKKSALPFFQVRDTIRHWYFVKEFKGNTEYISCRELHFSQKNWKRVLKKISKCNATSI